MLHERVDLPVRAPAYGDRISTTIGESGDSFKCEMIISGVICCGEALNYDEYRPNAPEPGMDLDSRL